MIAKLRRRHRLIFPVLAILIVVVSVAGIEFQQNPDVLNAELPGYENSSITDLNQLTSHRIEWDVPKVVAYLAFSDTEPVKYYIETAGRKSLSEPDILMYLNKDGDSKIEDYSILLGKLSNLSVQTFELPIQEISELEQATIILYSLPKKEVIATATISKREDSK